MTKIYNAVYISIGLVLCIYAYKDSMDYISNNKQYYLYAMILGIIFLILPNISTFKLGGLEITQKVEELQDELKSTNMYINRMINTIAINNSNEININLPNLDELHNMNMALKAEDDSQKYVKKYLDIKDNHGIGLSLAGLRMDIEKIITTITGSNNIIIREKIRQLQSIDSRYEETIQPLHYILSVCNKGVHNQLVDNKYYDEVILMSNAVLKQIDDITNLNILDMVQ